MLNQCTVLLLSLFRTLNLRCVLSINMLCSVHFPTFFCHQLSLSTPPTCRWVFWLQLMKADSGCRMESSAWIVSSNGSIAQLVGQSCLSKIHSFVFPFSIFSLHFCAHIHAFEHSVFPLVLSSFLSYFTTTPLFVSAADRDRRMQGGTRPMDNWLETLSWSGLSLFGSSLYFNVSLTAQNVYFPRSDDLSMITQKKWI